MIAMIFAAGYGQRLRPLTDKTPKPLIEVAGEPVIANHLRALKRAGVGRVVINLSHLADNIRRWVTDNVRDMEVRFSAEGRFPLETGGGLLAAMPFLDHDPVLAINADILTDFDFRALPTVLGNDQAHLVLVPPQGQGDFELRAGRVIGRGARSGTFAGIAVYRRELLAGAGPGPFSIVPWLERAMAAGRVSGQLHAGQWFDIGTPERLRRARKHWLSR